jgi:Rrf2 family iron-sulfur cluster assembly transcriptional regulator|tara:strand:- start:249 stop:698 length:450 start_codon:yes stop_codon:yes gene_type:complete
MKLTTKGRYAVLALTELALVKDETLVKITEISTRQNISSTYLEQLLLLLKNAGLVIGVRGPNGGYKLAAPAENIMISDIVNVVEGRLEARGCVAKSGSCTGVSGRCMTHDLWDELSRHIELFLGQISLKDIIRGNVLGRSSPPRMLEVK